MTRRYLTLLGLVGLIAGCDVAGENASRNAKAIDSDRLTAEGLASVVAPACSSPDAASDLVADVHMLVNIVRSNQGLEPLALNPALNKVADVYACAMIEEEFVAHEHPQTHVNNGDRLTEAGYLYRAWGENLAVGQETPVEVFVEWMASDSHRANIESDQWQEMGLAVRLGGEYGWYWVMVFADPVQLAQR